MTHNDCYEIFPLLSQDFVQELQNLYKVGPRLRELARRGRGGARSRESRNLGPTF